jgi:hypothetical protein
VLEEQRSSGKVCASVEGQKTYANGSMIHDVTIVNTGTKNRKKEIKPYAVLQYNS